MSRFIFSVSTAANQEKPAGAKKGAKRARGEVFGASVDDIW